MSDYADTGTSREGDPYAEIAALRAELERKDAALKVAGRVCAVVVDAELSLFDEHVELTQIDWEELQKALAAYRALQPKEPPCKA